MGTRVNSGLKFPAPPLFFDVVAAYRSALLLRQLRIARGDVPAGFKIGFTNRTIWPRYNVFAPIWGQVWSSRLTQREGSGSLSLAGTLEGESNENPGYRVARARSSRSATGKA